MHPKMLIKVPDGARKFNEDDQEYDTHEVATTECSDVKLLQEHIEVLT